MPVYRVKRTFRFQEGGTTYDLLANTSVSYDGCDATFDGITLRTRVLRGAIRARWLVRYPKGAEPALVPSDSVWASPPDRYDLLLEDWLDAAC